MKVTQQNMTATQAAGLRRSSTVYKMVVPESVEAKIRYLLGRFPDTEWSGVLFYTHSGSFRDKDLVITCADILPLNLGSSSYTEFSMSQEVANHIGEHIELFDCQLGMVHSHHRMGAFLSGTDLGTLLTQGTDMNNLVSLVVDTRGTYVAAVTRRLSRVCKITTETESLSYGFFGDGRVSCAVPPPSSETGSSDTVEYFMLDVERHEVPETGAPVCGELAAAADRIENEKAAAMRPAQEQLSLWDSPGGASCAPRLDPAFSGNCLSEAVAILFETMAGLAPSRADCGSLAESVIEKLSDFKDDPDVMTVIETLKYYYTDEQ